MNIPPHMPQGPFAGGPREPSGNAQPDKSRNAGSGNEETAAGSADRRAPAGPIPRSTASRLQARNAIGNSPVPSVGSGQIGLPPLASVPPPPSLRTPALRSLNPAAYIPDNAGLISSGRRDATWHSLVAHLQGQGIPIELEYLVPIPGRSRILHVVAGDGPYHVLGIGDVHTNENHHYRVDLAEGQAVGSNYNELRKLGLTFHWFYMDTDGARLCEKGLNGQPDPHRYASGIHRTLNLRLQGAWALPGTVGKHSFNGPFIPGALALMSIVNKIYDDGESIISIRHGHNAHVGMSDAYVNLPERYFELLASPFETAIEARGLKLKDERPESAAQEKAPGTKVTFSEFPVEEIMKEGGGLDPERYIAEVARLHRKPAPLSAVFEPVKWSQSNPNPVLQGLTLEQAVDIVNTTLGPLPSLTIQAEGLLSDYLEDNRDAIDHPLVDGGVSVARWDLKYDPDLLHPDIPAESSVLPEADAFARTVTALFYRTARVGQVVRALKQCGLDPQLQKTLSREMHRAINEVFKRGNLQPVNIANATRAMADVGLITLDRALTECR